MRRVSPNPPRPLRPAAAPTASPPNGTEGSVYGGFAPLEAISRDATCFLHCMVEACEWETNKGAITGMCVCVCVL